MKLSNLPPHSLVTPRTSRALRFVCTLSGAVALVAVGMGIEVLSDRASGAEPTPDGAPRMAASDEAKDLPTPPMEGIPMIKNAKGNLISLRPISVKESRQFADETGLSDGTYAWVHYNWGWEWKKGYSWRFPGETHAPGDKVTAISLEDAQAFCRWLTDKERARGTLPVGQFYRVVEADKMALMMAFHGRLQSSYRERWENMAPSFHIELAQDAVSGRI